MSKELNLKNRIGFHYFPDTLHYREHDLETWLPEIKALGAAWLTIQTPIERAIPEHFISGLSTAGVEPVIHLRSSLDFNSRDADFSIFFDNYSRWGAKYIAIYDRPNTRKAWSPGQWAQADLVENFLDLFIPAAEKAIQVGLVPIFPPLEPGGDYWDLAFLQTSLQGLIRRGKRQILEKLVIGAYAWTSNKPLGWGAGGPERWPNSQPYHTPAGSEDHIGFRIYEWYRAITMAELIEPLPILALGAGCRSTDIGEPSPDDVDFRKHAEQNMAIAMLISESDRRNQNPEKHLKSNPHNSEAVSSEMLPDEVLAINFWILAAAPDSPSSVDAWFQYGATPKPVVSALKQWLILMQKPQLAIDDKSGISDNQTAIGDNRPEYALFHPIDHYLLLPLYAWGVADWDLDAIRPYIQEHHPTVGFSLNEACLAARVTIIGEGAILSADTLDRLQACGCNVECLARDGTLLAI